MIHTVFLSLRVRAQRPLIEVLRDGRLPIEAEGRRVADHAPTREIPGSKGRGAVILAALIGIASFTGTAAQASSLTLLNVSYDPTREFYREYNAWFADWWEAQGNPRPEIQTSHGGSGAQARAVIDGLGAHVVTLALAGDIDAIATNTGKIPADWQSRLPQNASPYTSTIVFLVREGNPKGLTDWDDLVAEGVEVITPNPKTSGGARWNYLAAWGFALENGLDPQDFVARLYANVPVLDTAARGATTTFAQRGLGDVLLAWENEAHLALKELGEDQFDIVVPSVSVLAEPPVALVEGNITTEAERALATAYLEQLYSPEAQAIALRNFYRAWDSSAAAPEDAARFPEVNRLSIEYFGGWAEVQPKHFGDGGIFDQIYTAR
jgi:sulfate transport system substrate-binding protein